MQGGADSVLPFKKSGTYIKSDVFVEGSTNYANTNDHTVQVPTGASTCTIVANVFAWSPDGYPSTIEIYKNGGKITPNFSQKYLPSYHNLIAIAVIDITEGDKIRVIAKNAAISQSGVSCEAYCLIWS